MVTQAARAVNTIDACDHHADKIAGFVDARARIVNRAYAHAWTHAHTHTLAHLGTRTHTDRTRTV